MCCVQMSPHFNLFLGKNGCRVFSPKDQRDHSDFSSATDAKAHVCHGMGVQQSKQHGWLAYVIRCHWHGGIYWYIVQRHTAIKMMSFMGSPWLLDQDNASSHSACATTTWFHRHMCMWMTGQQICLLLNMYGPSWKEESDNDDHRLMGIWSLVSSEIGQNIAHKTFKN